MVILVVVSNSTNNEPKEIYSPVELKKLITKLRDEVSSANSDGKNLE